MSSAEATQGCSAAAVAGGTARLYGPFCLAVLKARCRHLRVLSSNSSINGLLFEYACSGAAAWRQGLVLVSPVTARWAGQGGIEKAAVPVKSHKGRSIIVVGTSAGGLEALDQLVGQLPTVIAERVSSDVAQVNGLGDQVPYNCPNCGGVLWEIDTPGEKRYRCHTGHSYTGPALLASQSEKIEEMLWISLRMFEERRNLLRSLSKTAGHRPLKQSTLQRLGETQGYIDRIRGMLLAPQSDGAEDTLTRVKGIMAEPRKAKSVRW